ncbi:MAG: M23 family metallopeptidase [Thainema sp.]
MTVHSWNSLPARSSPQPDLPIPVIQDEDVGLRPDWTQITLRSLPAIATSGSFDAPTDLIHQLGYDPSRRWQAGQTADQYLRLGDFQDSFQLQQLTLSDIAALVGLDEQTLRLADLALLRWQTLSDLVQAIPTLADWPVAQVTPLADVLKGTINLQGTIAEVIQDSVLADLSLAELNLESYALSAIPGLMETPLDAFRDWQRSVIGDIPGLADVPVAAFPHPMVEPGMVMGRVDVVFGAAESERTTTISGSDVDGFAVPCQTRCAHLELSQPEWIKGRQWISGQYQQVNGGRGVLASVNGGREPTGRHPFGPAFKVVVLETDEATGTAETGLYFRFCVRNSVVDLGCTPYFIGPVPWLPVQEEGWVLLGSLQSELTELTTTESAAAAGAANTIERPSDPIGKAFHHPDSATRHFRHPAPGVPVIRSFGYRTHPIHGDRRLHSGIDLDTPADTLIRAAAGGQVTFAGVSGSLTTGYGRLVIVDHGQGLATYYAHLQDVLVQAGDLIAPGDPLGHSDSRADSTEPHLHFEVRQNGQPQNPMSYFRGGQGS